MSYVWPRTVEELAKKAGAQETSPGSFVFDAEALRRFERFVRYRELDDVREFNESLRAWTDITFQEGAEPIATNPGEQYLTIKQDGTYKVNGGKLLFLRAGECISASSLLLVTTEPKDKPTHHG